MALSRSNMERVPQLKAKPGRRTGISDHQTGQTRQPEETARPRHRESPLPGNLGGYPTEVRCSGGVITGVYYMGIGMSASITNIRAHNTDGA